MSFQFSRRLAIVIGTVTPLAELVRRWHELRTLTVWWPAFLDDVLLGAFLLYGAWRTRKNQSSGRPVLTAAWGFMCGMAYSSLFIQLARLNESDPSGLAPKIVVSVKAIGLACGLVGLVCAFRGVDPLNADR